MGDSPETRMIGTVLRCYPARWRRRHGDEAAELAALLLRDGVAPRSIALSYLAGAAREWVVPRSGRRLSAVACALLVAACSVGLSAAMATSAMPARAASPASTASTASTASPGGHAHCQVGLASSAMGLTAAMGRPQAIIWEPGHDRSC
jgi:hypothetical protein